jgi:UDP-N-acetylglucosamine 2-epimerase (non-hydrolysing)
MKEWFESLEGLAKNNPEYTFILPIHPNPNVQRYRNLLKSVRVVSPMSHESFTNLLSSCKIVITDSGGLQEEASFFKKRVIVCRKTTERAEGMGDFFFLCAEPNNLERIFSEVIQVSDPILKDCPFGDGHTAKRIKDILYEKRIL